MQTIHIDDQAFPLSDLEANLAWRNLYQAAIFEDDKAKLAERIAAAENALRANAMALADSYDNLKEQRDMERAMYFLNLLGKQNWD